MNNKKSKHQTQEQNTKTANEKMSIIKQYRLKRKLTQEFLAEEVDISLRQFQRIEKEPSSTKISTIRKLIIALDIPAKEVYKIIISD